MRLISIFIIMIIFLFVGCNIETKNTEDAEELDTSEYADMLMPRLLADGKAIWEFGNREIEDTLDRRSHILTFQLLNYAKYTNPDSLENRLIGIDKIDFKLKTQGTLTNYNPSINDSIGILTLNFDSIESDSMEYYVDMNLKFKKTDSIFKYEGTIYLKD